MVYQGQNVVLVRDLTDTMYNSRMRPVVNHHTGTDLVIAHIEKHWAPTITSDQLAGGKPFRFDDDQRKRLTIVMAEDEYETEKTLPKFALEFLGKDFQISHVFSREEDMHDLPGIDVLQDTDLALVSIRRRAPPQAQLDVIRKFIEDGKPLVGIRTASHAFSLRDGQPPEGHAAWPEFDRDVLGGNYQGHHGNRGPGEPKTYVWVIPDAQDHPILAGVRSGEFAAPSWLYKTHPLATSATPLVMGRVEGRNTPEPVAWTNTHQGGGRVFYTSLGHPEDFKIPDVQRLLRNGIYWAAGLAVPQTLAAAKQQ
jgi:type 1 glutamine amidotransferase